MTHVAAVQHDIAWNDREANFEHLAPMIAGATASGADLIVLTETFSTGFGFDDPAVEAEPTGGPSAQFLADRASEHGVWVGGSWPRLPTLMSSACGAVRSSIPSPTSAS